MFWNLIARLLAWAPLTRLIIAVAKRTEYGHIYEDDETKTNLYMERFVLIAERWWFPIAARVHHIVRPDGDRDKHDHPVSFRTFVLRDWYIEKDLFDCPHFRAAGATVYHSAEYFHTIVSVGPDTWTLFIYMNWGPRNPWGFLKGDMFGVVKVPWKKYLDNKAQQRKLAAECAGLTDAQVAEKVVKASIEQPYQKLAESMNETTYRRDMSAADAVRNWRDFSHPGTTNHTFSWPGEDRRKESTGYDSRARSDEQQDFTGI